MIQYLILALGSVNAVFLAVVFLRMLNLKNNEERLEKLLRDEISRSRDEAAGTFKIMTDSIFSRMSDLSSLQKSQWDTFSKQLTTLTQINEQKLEKVRDAVESNLRFLREDNHKQLEDMRATVDEKLHSTLEKRLGESFKVVSDRLEKVHQGLGEMQVLANGVGDLKRVLTNVKTRGILGEVQLGNLLEQILTQEQYDRNVITKQSSRDPVEFAIRLPGRDLDRVYLPIDAKFPSEDYERLLKAQEDGNAALVEEFGKAIEGRIKLEAKKIKEKYLDPPHTTDFAIMFLPFEGLYAEVLRRPGLCDFIQREFRIIVAGPTTVAALLNSLQMGFRTLAVEKRASEVWNLLGSVKTEFGRFGDVLQKTREKLIKAGEEIESAERRSRSIERKLKDVQEKPLVAGEAPEPIGFDDLAKMDSKEPTRDALIE
jgi:DNA recombination protein RmuC